ncbi:MAG: Sua5/YciO/YrdC/YwlC family protein [Proteobacteria bacterium]|nr:MAG: Sua5/YciO/YrdC/YwlC family protein [Pseudomonadota bacterium]
MNTIGTAIDEAVQAVKQGGLLVYPTEAIYGLGGDYQQAEVVAKILNLKQRPDNQGLILVAGHIQHILPLIEPVSGDHLASALATWPGHTTWVFPASPAVPKGVKGPGNTVAVRLSDHPVVVDICCQLDHALISTSANKRGQTTPTDIKTLVQQWSADVAYFLDLPLGQSDQPSEIRVAEDRQKLR